MAGNFVQPGDTITLVAPYGLTSGQGAQVGNFFGVALGTFLISANGEFGITGVWTLAKTSAQAWTQGQAIYWDNTNRRADSDSSLGIFIGIATEAAANPTATGKVRLGATGDENIPQTFPVVTLAVDGAIPIANSIVTLTKGSAAAMTLAAPTAAQAGTRIVIRAGTAFAHVVTATGLLEDGVTGGAKNTATFGAFVGSSIELIAIGLKWTVLGKNVVTVA